MNRAPRAETDFKLFQDKKYILVDFKTSRILNFLCYGQISHFFDNELDNDLYQLYS